MKGLWEVGMRSGNGAECVRTGPRFDSSSVPVIATHCPVVSQPRANEFSSLGHMKNDIDIFTINWVTMHIIYSLDCIMEQGLPH